MTTFEQYETRFIDELKKKQGKMYWFNVLSPFDRAGQIYERALRENLRGSELSDFLNKWLETATKSAQIFEIWERADRENEGLLGEHDFTIENAAQKAISIAKSTSDAWDILSCTYLDVECKEFDMAFDKFLELCEYKEDVEWLMGQVCEWLSGSGRLEYEKYFLKIFQRVHELPHRSKETNPSEVIMD